MRKWCGSVEGGSRGEAVAERGLTAARGLSWAISPAPGTPGSFSCRVRRTCERRRPVLADGGAAGARAARDVELLEERRESSCCRPALTVAAACSDTELRESGEGVWLRRALAASRGGLEGVRDMAGRVEVEVEVEAVCNEFRSGAMREDDGSIEAVQVKAEVWIRLKEASGREVNEVNNTCLLLTRRGRPSPPPPPPPPPDPAPLLRRLPQRPITIVALLTLLHAV